MSRASLPLDYAPRPRWHRRKRTRRIALLIMCLALIPATIKWGPATWRRAQLLYWQHQCLTYTAPPDQVVLVCDPAGVTTVATPASEWIIVGTEATRIPPDCLRRLDSATGASGLMPTPMPAATSGPPTTFVSPMPYANGFFSLTFVATSRAPTTVAFLHERRSKGGNRRLVVVSVDMDELTCAVFEPATPFGSIKPSSVGPDSLLADLHFAWLKNPIGRIYAGQPDPSDGSHFTIAYDSYGAKNTLDGWLKDDDTVDFTVNGQLVSTWRVVMIPSVPPPPFPLPFPPPFELQSHPREDLIDDRPR